MWSTLLMKNAASGAVVGFGFIFDQRTTALERKHEPNNKLPTNSISCCAFRTRTPNYYHVTGEQTRRNTHTHTPKPNRFFSRVNWIVWIQSGLPFDASEICVNSELVIGIAAGCAWLGSASPRVPYHVRRIPDAFCTKHDLTLFACIKSKYSLPHSLADTFKVRLRHTPPGRRQRQRWLRD